MIAYLVQVTVCMAVFYLFYHIALRKETFFHLNRFYLLFTLLLSIALPLIRIYINQLHADSIVMQAPVYVGAYIQQLEDGIVITPEENSFSWKQALMVIYFAGVGLMFIRFLISFRSIWIIKAKATRVMIENQLCLISSQVRSPFSFFKKIYLPADHSFTEEEMKDVIRHEITHVRGKHSWDVILVEFIGILFWPCFFVFFYRNALREIHEYIADAAVIQKTPWTAYSEFLVQQRLQVFRNNFSSHLMYLTLKKRMIMMTQQKSPGISKWKFFGIIPMLIMLLSLIACQEENKSNSQGAVDDMTGKEKVDTISMNAQLQYFMNGYAIETNQLESAMLTSANHNLERIVILRADHNNTVQEVADVLNIADKVYARMVLLTDK